MIGIIVFIVLILTGVYIVKSYPKKPCGCKESTIPKNKKYIHGTGRITSHKPCGFSYSSIEKNDLPKEDYSELIREDVGEFTRIKKSQNKVLTCHKCGKEYEVEYNTIDKGLVEEKN